MRAALSARRADCVAHGRRYAWDGCVDQFLAALVTGDGQPVPWLPAPGLQMVA
jgi:hypothetical protein